MAAPSPFQNLMTPADVASRRRIADALGTQAVDASPVQHWTQGLARVVQGGAAGYYDATANQGEKERGSAVMQALSGDPSFGQLSPGLRGIVSQDPQLMQSVVGKVVAQKLAPKDTTTSGMREYQAAVSQGFKGTFLDYKKALAEASRPQTNVTVATDKEGAKILAKKQGERLDAADQARQMKSDLGVLGDISAKIGTVGAGANIKLALGPVANLAGVKIDGLPDLEAFSSVVSRLAPNMRPPGSGATSDFEFKQFLNALPKLSQTQEGRGLVLQQLNALADYKIKLGEIAELQLSGEIDRPTARKMATSLGNPMELWKRRAARQQAPSQAGGAPAQAQPRAAMPNGWSIQRLD